MSAASAVLSPSRDDVSVVGPRMGGTVGVHLRRDAGADPEQALREARRIHRRIGAWANRLTRFSDHSDLARLNDEPTPRVVVRPTLAALLDWGARARTVTGGIVDVTLLDARLEAESGRSDGSRNRSDRDRSWTLEALRRGAAVSRPPGLRFDLDGVGKGWLADRAVACLRRYPAAVVDADGDIAVALRDGEAWQIRIGHPLEPAATLATLELVGLAPAGIHRFGVATSGTNVHRWGGPGPVRHHLIDPRTGRSAVTDVQQATVLAESAAEAEAFAKTVVILGSAAALRLLDGPGPAGAVLFTELGEVLATPAMTRWLA